MADVIDYQLFDLQFGRDGTRYCARVLSSPAGETPSAQLFDMPVSDDQLRRLYGAVAQAQAGGLTSDSPALAPLREVGESLFTAVFAGEIGSAYRESAAKIGDAGVLRVRLRFGADTPDLLPLPWEFLCDPGGDFLSKHPRRSVERYVEGRGGAHHPRRLPLRVLVMVANPAASRRYEPIDASRELADIAAAIEAAGAADRVLLTPLPDASIGRLRARLEAPDPAGPFNVVHFIGHGEFDPATGEEYFVLLDEATGEPAPVAAGTLLTQLLGLGSSLQMVVLNCCGAVRPSALDPFRGAAPRLMKSGVPTAIVMSQPITDAAAVQFAGALYQSLAQGLAVDAALARARRQLDELNGGEWGLPLLYTRSPDGRLVLPPRSLGELKGLPAVAEAIGAFRGVFGGACEHIGRMTKFKALHYHLQGLETWFDMARHNDPDPRRAALDEERWEALEVAGDRLRDITADCLRETQGLDPNAVSWVPALQAAQNDFADAVVQRNLVTLRRAMRFVERTIGQQLGFMNVRLREGVMNLQLPQLLAAMDRVRVAVPAEDRNGGDVEQYLRRLAGGIESLRQLRDGLANCQLTHDRFQALDDTLRVSRSRFGGTLDDMLEVWEDIRPRLRSLRDREGDEFVAPVEQEARRLEETVQRANEVEIKRSLRQFRLVTNTSFKGLDSRMLELCSGVAGVERPLGDFLSIVPATPREAARA